MADIIRRKLVQYETTALLGVIQEEKEDWFTIDPNPTLPGPVFRVHRSDIKDVFDSGQKIRVHQQEESLMQVLIRKDATVIRMEFQRLDECKCCHGTIDSAPPGEEVFGNCTIDRCRTGAAILFRGVNGDVTVKPDYKWVYVPVNPNWNRVDWLCVGPKWDHTDIPKGTKYLWVRYDGREIINICWYR